MSRKAPKIELEELKKKLSPFLGDTDEFPYNLYDINKKLSKDLGKIDFDFENYLIGNADPSFAEYPSDCTPGIDLPAGYEVLENGLPVLFMTAGGDWEWPVCFVMYWDGKGIRAYIPEDGNVYNKKYKSAFGNHDDEVFDEKLIEEMASSAKIRQDVINRIQMTD